MIPTAISPLASKIGDFNLQMAGKAPYTSSRLGYLPPQISGILPPHWAEAINNFATTPLNKDTLKAYNVTKYNEYLTQEENDYGTLVFKPVPMDFIVKALDLYIPSWRTTQPGKLPPMSNNRLKPTGLGAYRDIRKMNLSRIIGDTPLYKTDYVNQQTPDQITALYLASQSKGNGNSTGRKRKAPSGCSYGKVKTGERAGLCRKIKKPRK